MYRALGFGLLVTMENFINGGRLEKPASFMPLIGQDRRFRGLLPGLMPPEPPVLSNKSFRKNGKRAFLDGEPDVAAGI